MRILVTGAGGFLGRRVVARLSQSYEVVAVVRSKSLLNVCETLCVDLTDERETEKLPLDIDAICHLAARVITSSSDTSLMDQVFRDNVKATEAVVYHAQRCQASRFVYTSSCSVYPRPTRMLPVGEDAPVAPIGDYARSKWQGEQLISAASDVTGMPAAILRCASIYGPGQAGTSVLPRFIALATAGNDLSVHGSGLRSQDFVWVDDVAEAVATCLETHLTSASTVFNVGSGEETTMLRLAELVLHNFARNHTQSIKRIGQPEIEPDRFWLDISKLSNLGWKPLTLDRGLSFYAMQQLATCS